MTEPNLKPCPFCGCKQIRAGKAYSEPGWVCKVHCVACEANVEDTLRKDAIALWNSRIWRIETPETAADANRMLMEKTKKYLVDIILTLYQKQGEREEEIIASLADVRSVVEKVYLPSEIEDLLSDAYVPFRDRKKMEKYL